MSHHSRPLVQVVIATIATIPLMFSTGASAFAENTEPDIQSTGNNESQVASSTYGSTASTAQKINVNTDVKATPPSNSPYDQWYSFTLPQNGVIQLTLKNTLVSSNAYWAVSLYTSDQPGSGSSKMYSFNHYANKTNELSKRVGLPAGTYYIDVYGSYDLRGVEYTINVSYSQSNSWETEPNDKIENADIISVNTTVSGSFTTVAYEDIDWYKFTVPQLGVISLQLDNPVNSDYSSINADIYKETDTGSSLDSYSWDMESANHVGTRIGVAAGTYYVKLRGWYAPETPSNQYSMRINYTASSTWEIEPNDNANTATPIKTDTTYTGTTIQYSDVDWYKFTLSKSQNVRLRYTRDNSTSFYANRIHLYRASDVSSSGQLLELPSYVGGQSIIMSKTLSLGAGSYYVQMEGANDPQYTITVQTGSNITDPMYRLYNSYTGEHFYTGKASERDQLVRQGWNDEGVGWVAPASGTPVYRLYNPYVPGGDHHYTTKTSERDQLVRQGWKYEGIGWYSGGSTPVYRQYNPYAVTGTHNYTTSKSENNQLVRNGWKAEGIGWYAVKAK